MLCCLICSFSMKRGSLSTQHVTSSDCGLRNGFQIWRIGANILIKYLLTVKKRWYSNFGVGLGANKSTRWNLRIYESYFLHSWAAREEKWFVFSECSSAAVGRGIIIANDSIQETVKSRPLCHVPCHGSAVWTQPWMRARFTHEIVQPVLRLIKYGAYGIGLSL